MLNFTSYKLVMQQQKNTIANKIWNTFSGQVSIRW